MMGSWWWMWMLVMFIVLIPPVGYGWGYRGWGPPYPSYIQRRRGQQAILEGGSSSFDHQSWGRGGDLLWTMVLIGMFCALATLWWP